MSATADISIRGKTRRDCPACGSMTMRMVWVEQSGRSWREVQCECGHHAEVSKIDRKVYSMLAPEDATALRFILDAIQRAADAERCGDDQLRRHLHTHALAHINRLQPSLRRKLGLPPITQENA